MADRSVRPASIDDASTIAAIQHAIWAEDYRPLVRESIEMPTIDALADAWRETIRTAPSMRHRVMVATEGPLVVGFASISPTDDETDMIDPLHVGSGRRRLGHGTRLITAIAETSAAMGAATIAAWAMEGDHPWTNLLASSGFALSGAERTLDLHGDERVIVVQHEWVASLEESE